jgi:hypothetical protein
VAHAFLEGIAVVHSCFGGLSAADIAEIVTAANESVGHFDYLLAHMRYTCARNAFILRRCTRSTLSVTRRYTPVARGVARGDRLAQAIHSRFDDDERRRKARVCTDSWG